MFTAFSVENFNLGKHFVKQGTLTQLPGFKMTSGGFAIYVEKQAQLYRNKDILTKTAMYLCAKYAMTSYHNLRKKIQQIC